MKVNGLNAIGIILRNSGLWAGVISAPTRYSGLMKYSDFRSHRIKHVNYHLLMAKISQFLLGAAFFQLTGCVTAIPLSPVAAIIQCHDTSRPVNSIVGGTEVGLGDPDQKLVSMIKIRHSDHDSICTGTLIGDRVILTAAHCVDGVAPENITLKFVTSAGCPVNQMRETSAEVIGTVVHGNFDGSPQSLADLALLYLDEKAPAEQQRLPLLNRGGAPTNDKILLMGFGITSETKQDSRILRKISKSFQMDIQRRDRALLIDQRNDGGGFCRGDSGAPILGEVWGEPHVIGVNSANIGIEPQTECQTMSLAMDILEFYGWISKNKKLLESSNWLTRMFSKSTKREL